MIYTTEDIDLGEVEIKYANMLSYSNAYNKHRVIKEENAKQFLADKLNEIENLKIPNHPNSLKSQIIDKLIKIIKGNAKG